MGVITLFFLYDLFSCRLLATPIFPRRLSSVQSKFSISATKKIILVGCHPTDGVTRGASPLVTPQQ